MIYFYFFEVSIRKRGARKNNVGSAFAHKDVGDRDGKYQMSNQKKRKVKVAILIIQCPLKTKLKKRGITYNVGCQNRKRE